MFISTFIFPDARFSCRNSEQLFWKHVVFTNVGLLRHLKRLAIILVYYWY